MSLSDDDLDQIEDMITRAIDQSLDKNDSDISNEIRSNVEKIFEERVDWVVRDAEKMMRDVNDRFDCLQIEFKVEFKDSLREMQEDFDDKVADLEDTVADLKKEIRNLESENEYLKRDLEGDIRDLNRIVSRLDV